MERTPRTLLITLIGILFFIGIILFGYNRFGKYIHGPSIKSISLQKHEYLPSKTIQLSGIVSNTTLIHINNREIIPNQDHSFSDTIVVSSGLTIIDIDIEDAFGKTKAYQYHIYSSAENSEYPITYDEALQRQKDLENQEQEIKTEL